MLIIALVLAAIGLAALVFAVVTSNALVAWVCIGASLLGVLLLIVDALRERRRQSVGAAAGPVAVDRTAVSDDDDAAVGDDSAETSEEIQTDAAIDHGAGGGFDASDNTDAADDTDASDDTDDTDDLDDTAGSDDSDDAVADEPAGQRVD